MKKLEKLELRKEKITEILKADGIEVELQSVKAKKNNVTLYGLRLLTGSNVCPIIYIDELSDEEAVSAIKKTTEMKLPEAEVFKECLKPEYMLSHVRPRLIEKNRNNKISIMENHLANVSIWNKFYVLFFIEMSFDGEKGKKDKAIHVREEHLGEVTLTELFKAAQNNVKKRTIIASISEIIASRGGYSQKEIASLAELSDSAKMYVITTDDYWNGAAAIISPEIIELAYKKVGSRELFIVPSSIHELLLLPFDEKRKDELYEMVKDVNRTLVAAPERLTDSLLISKVGYGYGNLSFYP